MKELIKEFNKLCRENEIGCIIDDDYNENEMYKILYFIAQCDDGSLNELILKVLRTLKPKNNVQKIYYVMLQMVDNPQ